jgi:hypothetical protein
MYNPEHHQSSSSSSFMAPRMSFSSDFALEPPPATSLSARAPGDADFEFSVGGRPAMMGAADELFSKGRLLPLQEAPHGRPTTLREELRTEDGRHGRAPRAPNIRWKELLGFKKAAKKASGAAAADAAAGTSSAEAHTVLNHQSHLLLSTQLVMHRTLCDSGMHCPICDMPVELTFSESSKPPATARTPLCCTPPSVGYIFSASRDFSKFGAGNMHRIFLAFVLGNRTQKTAQKLE